MPATNILQYIIFVYICQFNCPILEYRGTCSIPAAADLSPQLAEAQAALSNDTKSLEEAKQATGKHGKAV